MFRTNPDSFWYLFNQSRRGRGYSSSAKKNVTEFLTRRITRAPVGYRPHFPYKNFLNVTEMSLYPSLEDMQVDRTLQAQNRAQQATVCKGKIIGKIFKKIKPIQNENFDFLGNRSLKTRILGH